MAEKYTSPKGSAIRQLNDELEQGILRAAENNPLVALGLDRVGVEQMTTLFKNPLKQAKFDPAGFSKEELVGAGHVGGSPVDFDKPSVVLSVGNMVRRGPALTRSDMAHEYGHAGIAALANFKPHNIDRSAEEAIMRYQDIQMGGPKAAAESQKYVDKRYVDPKGAMRRSKDRHKQLSDKAAKRLYDEGKRSMSKTKASEIASKGRYGDTMLVHMNPIEVQLMHENSPTGLTINPETGQPEAFLPLLAGLAGGYLGPGLFGTYMSTLGATALGAGLGSFGGHLVQGDDLGRAALGGLTTGALSYGLGGMFQGAEQAAGDAIVPLEGIEAEFGGLTAGAGAYGPSRAAVITEHLGAKGLAEAGITPTFTESLSGIGSAIGEQGIGDFASKAFDLAPNYTGLALGAGAVGTGLGGVSGQLGVTPQQAAIIDTTKDRVDIPEQFPTLRTLAGPAPANFRAGFDPERRSFIGDIRRPRRLAAQGGLVKKYQEGGLVDSLVPRVPLPTVPGFGGGEIDPDDDFDDPATQFDEQGSPVPSSTVDMGKVMDETLSNPLSFTGIVPFALNYMGAFGDPVNQQTQVGVPLSPTITGREFASLARGVYDVPPVDVEPSADMPSGFTEGNVGMGGISGEAETEGEVGGMSADDWATGGLIGGRKFANGGRIDPRRLQFNAGADQMAMNNAGRFNRLGTAQRGPGAMMPGAMMPNTMMPGAMRPGAMMPGAMRPGAMMPGASAGLGAFRGPTPLPPILSQGRSIRRGYADGGQVKKYQAGGVMQGNAFNQNRLGAGGMGSEDTLAAINTVSANPGLGALPAQTPVPVPAMQSMRPIQFGGLIPRQGFDPLRSARTTQGGLVRGFAIGGGPLQQSQQDPIVQGAIAAIMGQHPEPQAAIQAFIQVYGPQAFAALRAKIIAAGTADQRQMSGLASLVNGAGDGLSDSVPANIEGQAPVALSDGEVVVPADVVSGLGNGSSDAGAREIEKMNQGVRQARTGTRNQPRAIDAETMLPRLG